MTQSRAPSPFPAEARLAPSGPGRLPGRTSDPDLVLAAPRRAAELPTSRPRRARAAPPVLPAALPRRHGNRAAAAGWQPGWRRGGRRARGPEVPRRVRTRDRDRPPMVPGLGTGPRQARTLTPAWQGLRRETRGYSDPASGPELGPEKQGWPERQQPEQEQPGIQQGHSDGGGAAAPRPGNCKASNEGSSVGP
ncbi:uncharacterized protein ACBT57_010719 [Dama dama]